MGAINVRGLPLIQNWRGALPRDHDGQTTLGLVPHALDRIAIILRMPHRQSLRSLRQTEVLVPDRSASLDCFTMVRALGLEPRTLGLENRCSIQLSYALTINQVARKAILAKQSICIRANL